MQFTMAIFNLIGIRRVSPWTGDKLQRHSLHLQERDARLPAQQHWQHIEGAVTGSKVALIQGSPGCGKSTQVPQLISEFTPQHRALIWLTRPFSEGAQMCYDRLLGATQDVKGLL